MIPVPPSAPRHLALLALCLAAVGLPAAVADVLPSERDGILNAIAMFKRGSKQEIMGLFRLPFYRGVGNGLYPLRSIRTVEELSAAFSEIIDDRLIAAIAASDLDRNYASAGWRGTMFDGGAVWFDSGKIHAVNVRTKDGRAAYEKAVQADRLGVPAGYRDYDQPVMRYETDTHVVRVDRTKDDYRLLVCDRTSGEVQVAVHGGSQLDVGTMGGFNLVWLDGGRLRFVEWDAHVDEHEMQYTVCRLQGPGEMVSESMEENVAAPASP